MQDSLELLARRREAKLNGLVLRLACSFRRLEYETNWNLTSM